MAGLLLAVCSCIDLSTNPHEILSIEFPAPPSPSLVAGDTLRDQDGAVAPLTARLFDASGAEVPDPQVSFLSRDTTVSIVDGNLLVAHDSAKGTARLFAVGANIQSSVQQLTIVPRPDTVGPSGTIDTLRLALPDDPQANQSGPLAVKVLSHGETADAPVPAWIVSFSLEYHGEAVAPGDTSQLFLMNDSGHPSTADTTDANGLASRRVRFKVVPGTQLALVDSVIVYATASYRGLSLTGAPVRLVLPITPR